MEHIIKNVDIQRAFPYLSADEREVLITGMCYDCQAKVFGPM